MSHNLAVCCKEERDKVNLDLTVSGVIYKECMTMPVIATEIKLQQSEDSQRKCFYAPAALQEHHPAVPVQH